ncbi:hypothetical protein ACRTAL_002386 [Clostridium perfringens]
MNLREFLRKDFHKYIRNKLIKNKCEICGSEENLHLHHIDRFYNSLMETLQELNLCELDTDKYDEEELKNIRYYMLAKQIQSEYKTLCKECHNKIHFKESKTDEYKKYYYNPYGNYVFINMTKLKELNINNAELCHFIFICTFIKYNTNKIALKIAPNKYKDLTEGDLINLLTLSQRTYYRLKNTLLKENLISINKDNITINKEVAVRSNIYKKDDYIKIFSSEFQEIYNKIDNRRLKTIGSVINISDKMDNHNIINITNNELVKSFGIADNGLSRYMNKINENIDDKLFKKIEKNKYMINPRFIYKGYFTTELKGVIDKYNIA